MLSEICKWIQKITEYLMIISMVLAIAPGNDYKKYIQFFAGIMFLLLCCSPVLQLLNMEDSVWTVFENADYIMNEEKVGQKEKRIVEKDITEYLPQNITEEQTTADNVLKVEEIKVE